MTAIRLYTQRINPFSGKVVGALRLKKLPFERTVSDDPADARRWNPATGQLPVLQIGEERRPDSNRIIEWLDELYPEPPLYAADPKTAAAQKRLAEWADASFLFYWDRWRTARYPRPGDAEPVAPGPLDAVRSQLDRWLGRPDRVPTRVQVREIEVLSELSHRLDDLVGMLGERSFFHSDSPSVADLSIYGMLRVVDDGPMTRGPEMIAERPALAAFLARMHNALAEPHDDSDASHRPAAESTPPR